MKKYIFIMILSMWFFTSSNAQEMNPKDTVVETKTETFTVYGNCGMCKRTIEGAFKDAKEVSAAEWNMETDVMTVTFNPNEISIDNIKQKIADVGHDTETHKAKDSVYNNLPGCCQYERPE